MKKSIQIVLALFVTLSLFSCFEDNENTKSCYSIDKITETNYGESTQVNTQKNIEFNISNECSREMRVLEVSISGENQQDFYIEGLNNNTIIPENGKNFTLVFLPRTAGNKEITIVIKLDVGETIIQFNATAS